MAFERGEDPEILAGADVVVSERFVNQRLAAVPMEPNGILVTHVDDGLLVRVPTQAPNGVHGAIAAAAGLAPEKVRIIAPAVGGGFGAKMDMYVEYAIAVKSALALSSAREVDRDPFREHGGDEPRSRPDPARRDGIEARRHDRGAADQGVPGRRCVSRDGRVPRVLHASARPGRVFDSQGGAQLVERGHEHHHDGGLPWRRASGSHRDARTHHRHRRRRARASIRWRSAGRT